MLSESTLSFPLSGARILSASRRGPAQLNYATVSTCKTHALTIFGLLLILATAVALCRYRITYRRDSYPLEGTEKIKKEASVIANQPYNPCLARTNVFEPIQGKHAESDPAEVMSKVVAAYHSFSTYSDTGKAIVHLSGSDVVYTVSFETTFKRPNKLRFACTAESNRTPGHQQKGIIWSDGITATASYSYRGSKPEVKKNLDSVVASVSGVSWGSVHPIFRLLTDDVSGFRLDELNKVRTVGTEPVDGIDCVVFVGDFRSGGQCKVWVGRADYLIRRIEERSETMRREEVRTQIVVNQDIPDSRFSQQGR